MTYQNVREENNFGNGSKRRSFLRFPSSISIYLSHCFRYTWWNASWRISKFIADAVSPPTTLISYWWQTNEWIYGGGNPLGDNIPIAVDAYRPQLMSMNLWKSLSKLRYARYRCLSASLDGLRTPNVYTVLRNLNKQITLWWWLPQNSMAEGSMDVNFCVPTKHTPRQHKLQWCPIWFATQSNAANITWFCVAPALIPQLFNCNT